MLPRAHLYESQGCGRCKASHGEQKISLILKLLNIKFIKNKTFDNCLGTKGGKLKFDFFLPDYNYCLEYDGKQHFDKKSRYWSKEVEIHDKIKNKYCKEKNINLHRIHYKDFEKIEEILKATIFS